MARVGAECVELRAPVEGRVGEVLTADALDCVAGVQRTFNRTRDELLRRRL